MTVRVIVNGQPRQVPAGTTVAGLAAAVTAGAAGAAGAGFAAAVNGAVVPRRDWDGALVRDGDRVEIVTAVPGG